MFIIQHCICIIGNLTDFINTMYISECHKLILEVVNCTGGLQHAKAILQLRSDPGQQPPGEQAPTNGVPIWCVCQRYRPMRTEIDENRCCQQKSFENLVLDWDALSVAIIGQMDITVD